MVVNPEKLAAALEQYYSALGWTDNGNPTPAKLESLGLAWVTL
ncbi:MAG: hypothetical protein JW862_00270 [Anaerolineales bacterium]|nr:hypothetical protein [Anaerolineales bacterium]